MIADTGNPPGLSWQEIRRPLHRRNYPNSQTQKACFFLLTLALLICTHHSSSVLSSCIMVRAPQLNSSEAWKEADAGLIFELPAAGFHWRWPPEGGERVYPGLNGSMACQLPTDVLTSHSQPVWANLRKQSVDLVRQPDKANTTHHPMWSSDAGACEAWCSCQFYLHEQPSRGAFVWRTLSPRLSRFCA